MLDKYAETPWNSLPAIQDASATSSTAESPFKVSNSLSSEKPFKW